jgi:hypothetical protein
VKYAPADITVNGVRSPVLHARIGADAIWSELTSPAGMQGAALGSACRGGCCGSGVLDGENKDQVARLVEVVDDRHPSPGSEDEAHRVPASVELPADAGELLDDAQGARDAILGIGGKAVGNDHAVEIRYRDHAQPDFGQWTYSSSSGIVSPDRARSRPS